MKKTGKEIIESILIQLNIKAPTFAANINVAYQRIFDIQRGKTKRISPELADKITYAYPQFSFSWLLSGEGEMLKDGITQTISGNNNISSIIGNGNGDVNIGHGREVANGMPSQKDELHRLEKEMETLQKKNEEYLKEIEYLKSALIDKERLIQVLLNNLTNKE